VGVPVGATAPLLRESQAVDARYGTVAVVRAGADLQRRVAVELHAGQGRDASDSGCSVEGAATDFPSLRHVENHDLIRHLIGVGGRSGDDSFLDDPVAEFAHREPARQTVRVLRHLQDHVRPTFESPEAGAVTAGFSAPEQLEVAVAVGVRGGEPRDGVGLNGMLPNQRASRPDENGNSRVVRLDDGLGARRWIQISYQKL